MEGRSDRFSTPSLAGVELHVLHWGDPSHPAIVLLHGGGANAHWWDHLAPSLAERHHVLALDFRGHGDSDYPDRVFVGAFEEDLRALLEHLGEIDVTLVGHSMGGHVALAYAAGAPSLRDLIVVDVERGASPRSRRKARLALTFRRSYGSREQAVERFRFLPPAERASESLRRAIALHSVREEPGGRFGFKFDPRWFSIPRRPLPDLGSVLCPTLLIRGAESDLISRDAARSLVESIPDARLVEIERAGHHVHIDRPQAVLSELRSFIARPT